MGSNNFLQWNPNALNQQTDGQYVTESMRTGGAVSGIFAKEIANKLFFQCTTMVAALGEMLSNKGYTVSDANITTLISILTNILTKADFGSSAGTVCQGNDDRLNEAGMRAWFGQNTAPTGWTIDATAADGLLAVKGGSAAYNTTGGTQAGTWTQADADVTLPAHTHSISITSGNESANHTHSFSATSSGRSASHTHTVSGGAHTHTLRETLRGGATNSNLGGTTYPDDYFISTEGTGEHTHTVSTESADHTHSVSGTTGTISANHTHSVSGTSASTGSGTGTHNHGSTWRPLANVGIVCIKS